MRITILASILMLAYFALVQPASLFAYADTNETTYSYSVPTNETTYSYSVPTNETTYSYSVPTNETTYSYNSDYDWLPCGGGSCYTATTYTPSYTYSSCNPSTCSQYGYQCGSWNNGCGGTMYCGTCSGNSVCSSGHCTSTCQTSTCSQLNYQCGSWNDGCGGTMYCGSCYGNQVCSGGRCVSTCSSECGNGATRCNGNSVQTCRDTNGDGCFEWDGINSCGYNQTCQNGSCVNSCQPKTCSQLGMQCGNVYDGCNGNIFCGSCSGNQICQNGHCVSTCSNQCNSGQTRCYGNGVQTCRDTNGDGCTEWDGVDSCGYNQTCQNGSCSSTCSNQCSSGDRRCSGNGYQVCGRYDGSNCYSWGQTVNCGYNQTCRNGDCQSDYHPSDFSVSLYASPNSGCAPLGNISLTATVSGYSNNYDNYYGNGEFTYYFSCDGDGQWDRTVHSSNTSVTVNDACDNSRYQNHGNHTARVRVTRDGREASGQTQININDCDNGNTDNRQLKVALYSNPAQGCAPLNGVSLRALVTNSNPTNYNGYFGNSYELTFSFDCDNDGTFEKIVNSSETEVVVNNLCNYSNSGNYTARVRVDGRGRWATDTAIIRVNYCQNQNIYIPSVLPPAYVAPNPLPAGTLSVQKTVSNLSNGTQYQTAVTANPGDTVSFRIAVNPGSYAGGELIVSDIIPSGITNVRDLKLDGQSIAGNISSGISINDFGGARQRIVTFSASVANASNFPYGQTTLTDTATARNAAMSNSSSATVYVWRQAVLGATKVSTGIIDSNWINYLIAGIVAMSSAFWLFRNKLVELSTNLKNCLRTRAISRKSE